MSMLGALRRRIARMEREREAESYYSNRCYEIDRSALIDDKFRIVHQVEPDERTYVTIGERCILNCSIIFESKSGKVSIGKNTYIGDNSRIISVDSVSIGEDVMVSWGVTIYDHDGHSILWEKRRADHENAYRQLTTDKGKSLKDWSCVERKAISIGSRCWIGFDAVILKGVSLGERTIVGARSVVTKSFPSDVVVAGNPARIVKRLD